MTEAFLDKMSISELFDLMVKLANELLDMHKQHEDANVLDSKRKEIEMVQNVIANKRTAETPLK